MKSIGSSVLLAALATGGSAKAASFADDVAFLQKHVETIVLTDKAGQAKVALVPAYQGRIMTSTANGDSGLSFGWLNRELISSGKPAQHINVFGGEDRFWLGPEGGQFSIFFAKGVPFDLEHWFTPAAIDTLPFRMVSHDKTKAKFEQEMTLTNYSGSVFDLKVEREVRMLTARSAWRYLRAKSQRDVNVVAFESVNTVRNTGKNAWTKDTGLLSVWILGMYNPSPAATVVVPINAGPESELGPQVTSDYFGVVPANRLVVKDGTIFFKADGEYRSKIGISPKRSKALLGSYDAAAKALTLVQFTQPKGVTDYVNSLWKLQDKPFGGDASNSYNDGPPSPGAKPLGPFYELESSSPAAALKPGKKLEHVHRTIHITGPETQLDAIARATLGVTLQDIATALPK